MEKKRAYRKIGNDLSEIVNDWCDHPTNQGRVISLSARRRFVVKMKQFVQVGLRSDQAQSRVAALAEHIAALKA